MNQKEINMIILMTHEKGQIKPIDKNLEDECKIMF